ncbi:hypothetical protein F2Q70_00025014 [Brassica cretica]|uniref:Transmembrane protein n=1 Tax=Brassica cretica TaxID=69181 RepID=A0A8S9LCF4_BRACR|nr:hypothetical protein F2Q70_00025014 [Brassica cretica]
MRKNFSPVTLRRYSALGWAFLSGVAHFPLVVGRLLTLPARHLLDAVVGFCLRRPCHLLWWWSVGTWLRLASSVDVDGGFTPGFPGFCLISSSLLSFCFKRSLPSLRSSVVEDESCGLELYHFQISSWRCSLNGACFRCVSGGNPISSSGDDVQVFEDGWLLCVARVPPLSSV